ncbi:MAG TPA: adenylate/guanylate cyclase domain-containing protein [Gaiellaceae bacterium]|nr:adenylate/guanylate cyclase domain-containing protein [Gaiellaceae bacterium]
MANSVIRSFRTPDEVVRLPKLTARLVELGELTLGYEVTEPGWRWSEHVRPSVGGDLCQVRHVGVVLSGRLGILLEDGTELVYEAQDVFDIPPGHDGYTIGDEPCVQLTWAGNRPFFAGFLIGSRSRVLATLLFTDLVDSTAVAARLGDIRWRELLSGHFHSARAELERYGGREVKTTGDGMLATFDGPGQALRCAAAIRRIARRDALEIRAGVHVGEVEVVGDDIRGVAVHEAQRIMAAAGADEILVSDLTRALAGAAGLSFEDRGTNALKGLDGEWRLAAFVAEPSGS